MIMGLIICQVILHSVLKKPITVSVMSLGVTGEIGVTEPPNIPKFINFSARVKTGKIYQYVLHEVRRSFLLFPSLLPTIS